MQIVRSIDERSRRADGATFLKALSSRGREVTVPPASESLTTRNQAEIQFQERQ